MGADAGDWADELITTSSQMGVDVETLQSWRYASRFIDTSVEDISRSWQDLTKRIKDGDVEYLGYLAEMGVASMNADGTMRESQDIFWDMIDTLHAMEDPQARAAAATKLFGNDWRNLNPLIEAGSEAYKDLAEEGRETAVVSEENVNALGAMDDAMEEMSASFDKLKYDALAAMAPTFEKIASAMNTAITALDKFLESAEGQAMLASLNESLSGIIDAFIGENGEGFESLVNTAKDALNGLNTALSWIAEHKDGLVTAVEAIAAAFAGLKVSSTVLEFVKLANGAKGLFGLGDNGGKPSIPNLPNSKPKVDVGDVVEDAAGAAAAKEAAKRTLGSMLADILPGASGAVFGALGAAYAVEEIWNDYLNAEGARLQGDAASVAQQVYENENSTDREFALADVLYTASNIKGDVYGWTDQAKIEAFRENFAAGTDLYNTIMETFGSDGAVARAMEAAQTGGVAEIDELFALIEPALIQELTGQDGDYIYKGAEVVGENVSDGIAEGIENEAGTAEEASAAMAEGVIDAATSALDEHSPSKVFDTIGRNAAIGLANGIYAGGNSAILAALWLAKSVENIVRSALQIHSPSAVFDDLGGFVGEGFAEGISGSADNVSRAVDKMVSATMRRPVMSIGGYSVSPVTGARAGSGAGAAGAADMVNVTLVLDEEVLGSVMAPIVNDKIGAKIQATRR